MDNFIKQLRVRFSGLGEENQDDPSDTRGTRIPPQKTVSFKGDRKRGQNWFQRQFSDQMSEIDDSSDGEFGAAVAAAAFVITSQEEGGPLKHKILEEGLRRTLTKSRSKKEGREDKETDNKKISRWFSSKEGKEDETPTGDSSMRKSATLDQRLLEESAAERKAPLKPIGTSKTVKKTSTSFDKYPNEEGNKSFELGQGPRTTNNVPSTIRPTASSPGSGKWDVNRIDSGRVETKADAWEKAKMTKIKERYEKLITTILEWENEKKAKAKRRMERKEREIEERRGRVSQEHLFEMSRIEKIAGGARALADERKRNDESKTIEKAKGLRSTGKVPNECCSCL